MKQVLTVIMPVYNAMPFLREAVASVFSQTYRNFRFLAIDDGSTDGSGEYLDSLTDPRLEVYHQQNAGEIATVNRAASAAETEYTAMLHADDIAMPDRLERQVRFLETHADYACTLTNFVRVTNGKAYGTHLPVTDDGISEYDSRLFSAITMTTMCWRTERWKELGGFRPPPPTNDFDWLLRCEETHKMAVFHRPLVQYRVHGNSMTERTFIRREPKIRYVKANAARRRAGEREISFEEFERAERLSPFPVRFSRMRDALGRFRFRKSGIAMAEGRPVECALNMLIALALRPSYVCRRLGEVVRFRKNARPLPLGFAAGPEPLDRNSGAEGSIRGEERRH